MPTKKSRIPVQTVVKKVLIDVKIPVKKAEILFQMFIKKSLIAVQTSFQEVPNQPKNTSAMPFRVFVILVNQLFIKSQMPVKIP